VVSEAASKYAMEFLVPVLAVLRIAGQK